MNSCILWKQAVAGFWRPSLRASIVISSITYNTEVTLLPLVSVSSSVRKKRQEKKREQEGGRSFSILNTLGFWMEISISPKLMSLLFFSSRVQKSCIALFFSGLRFTVMNVKIVATCDYILSALFFLDLESSSLDGAFWEFCSFLCLFSACSLVFPKQTCVHPGFLQLFALFNSFQPYIFNSFQFYNL